MHIVVIEDDPRIRDFLSRGLAAEGYQVEAVASTDDPEPWPDSTLVCD